MIQTLFFLPRGYANREIALFNKFLNKFSRVHNLASSCLEADLNLSLIILRTTRFLKLDIYNMWSVKSLHF